MAKVFNTTTYPIDVSDGRVVASGEFLDNVDTDHPHQRNLILDGHLVVQEGTKPRVRQNEKLVKQASEPNDNEE